MTGISFETMLEEDLQRDPAARARWAHSALARAVSLAVIDYRATHGLSQTVLARKLGMRQPAIARLELGEHTPGLDTLLRLSGRLGLEFQLHITPVGRPARLLEPATATGTVRETVAADGSIVTVGWSMPSEAADVASDEQPEPSHNDGDAGLIGLKVALASGIRR